MFVGAVGGGLISDRLGRKRSLVGDGLRLLSLFSLLNGLAPDIPSPGGRRGS